MTDYEKFYREQTGYLTGNVNARVNRLLSYTDRTGHRLKDLAIVITEDPLWDCHNPSPVGKCSPGLLGVTKGNKKIGSDRSFYCFVYPKKD